MAPLRLDIVVDDQGQPVPQSFAQPVGQDMPVGVSTLSPDESIPMHEVMQSKALAFHAVQSLNTLAAQAAAEFQRLREPVAALIEQATATNVHAAFLTENARFQKMWSSMTEENTRFQQFQKELSIAPLWEEESKRLQKMAASFQVMNERIHEVFRVEEHLQRAMSSFQPLVDLRWKEDQTRRMCEENERLQRIASSFRAMEGEAQALIHPNPPAWLAAMRTEAAHLQALINPAPPPWLATIRDALLSLPATVIPEWAQVRQLSPAAFERRMCADALQTFAHEPEHAKQFVQALRLPLSPSFLCAVWEALREGRWMNADNPLRYVRSVAYSIYKQDKEQNESLFNSTFLSLDAGPTGALLPPPLHVSCNPWSELEDRCDKERLLEQQGLSAGLSSDALTVYKLREIHGQHISRRTLPDMLQWTPKRVASAWREMCRKIGPRKKLG